MSGNLTGIKITQLNDIGANISPTSLIPIVDTTNIANPVTDKANLQILGNLILTGAGGSFFPPAWQSTLSQSVTNAAQPNITSLGNLSNLSVTSVGALNIPGGYNGYYLQTDGAGNLTWSIGGGSGNGEVGGANTQVQFNNSGNFGGSSGFTFNNTSNILTLTGNIITQAVVSNTFVSPNNNINVQAKGNVYIVTDLNANVGANVTWTFGQGGALYWPAIGGNIWAIEPNPNNQFELKSTTGIVISTDTNNTNSHFTFDNHGIFTAPSNVNLLGSTLNIGPNAQAFTNTLTSPTVVIAFNGNNYIQTAQYNDNPNGSSDFVAYASGSTESEGWTDFGFAGPNNYISGYSATFPGDGYLIVQGYANGVGGNLVLATGDNTSPSDIVFGLGGFNIENEFARMEQSTGLFHLVANNAGIKFADGTTQYTAGNSTGNFVFTGDTMKLSDTGTMNISGGNATSMTFGANNSITMLVNAVSGVKITTGTVGLYANNILSLSLDGSKSDFKGQNIINVNAITSSVSVTTPVAVASLPSATTAGQRAFANNANLVAVGNFGAIVGAGGSNIVPVYSDGTNWRIG